MFEDKKLWEAVDNLERNMECDLTRLMRDARIKNLEDTLYALIQRLGWEKRIEPAKPAKIVFVKAEKKED